VTHLWLYAAVFLFGLLVGSFLNVCAYRLPRKQSVVWPASHCPHCATSIKVYDNLPVLSYLLLKGQCRTCRTPISARYPIVEMGNAVGYMLIVWHFGLEWSSVVYATLFSALLVITCIDCSHQIIPDRITLPGIMVGFVSASIILPVGWLNSLLGILMGGGLLWLLAWVSPYIFGKEGMGGGDIKFLAMIGAFLGWKPTLLTILVGAVFGSIVGLCLILLQVIRRDQYLPFGPFLALGAVVSMFFHREILNWYVSLLIGSP
jgi:leader peptidase (prepilin peptidase)/N-methyltransferase